MQATKLLAAYAVTAVAFLGLDAVWLTTMTQRLYKPSIGHLLAPQPDFAAAGIFYLLYVAGMLYFAVLPGVREGRPALALLQGAGLGLLAYATYDLTNQATLRDWPWTVTLADLAWGTFATGAASAIACAVLLRLGQR